MFTVMGENNGHVQLISKDDNGIISRGTFLTAIDGNHKFILRVEDSNQINAYEISPMLSEMDLKPLIADQKVKNIVSAIRIKELPKREDGYHSYIKPYIEARRSTQSEIDEAIGKTNGIPVFLATSQYFDSQIMKDDNGNLINVNIPFDFFFYQTLISGATGSGKTAALKYLLQNFIGKYGGAVLAINVKEDDLLYMDKPSITKNNNVLQEWNSLNMEPHGLRGIRIYYPGQDTPKSELIDPTKTRGITIITKTLEPENLIGIVQNLTDRGAEQVVDIFRYWQKNAEPGKDTMNEFIDYLSNPDDQKSFHKLTATGAEFPITLHRGTLNSLINAFTAASIYFDNSNARELNAEDILEERKFSVIDLSQKNAIGFGGILLRNILDKIYEKKNNGDNNVPILIIIDEVHEFYGNTKTFEALKTLDAIARKGRSLKIGVIFASQNIEDMPSGISKIVNSKIYLRGYTGKRRNNNSDEMLGSGFAIADIYNMRFVDLIKFPFPLGGLYEK